MIRKGLQVINILALVLSGFAYSWVYTEHTDISSTKNEQSYTQKINNFNNIDSIKSSYIKDMNTNKKSINVHNYKAEKIINILLTVIVLLGLNFIFLIILSEQHKKTSDREN